MDKPVPGRPLALGPPVNAVIKSRCPNPKCRVVVWTTYRGEQKCSTCHRKFNVEQNEEDVIVTRDRK